MDCGSHLIDSVIEYYVNSTTNVCGWFDQFHHFQLISLDGRMKPRICASVVSLFG
jgi:hypothetical protein